MSQAFLSSMLALLSGDSSPDHPKKSIAEAAEALRIEAFSSLFRALEAFLQEKPYAIVRRVNPIALVREFYGVESKDELAKAFLDAWRETTNGLLLRLNKAGGGDDGLLGDFFPAQSSDPEALALVFYDSWVKHFDFADWARMRKDHGLDDHGLDQALRRVYDALCARATSRADRITADDFLRFASANSFLRYHDRFANCDPLGALFDRLDFLCQQIALIERLGPDAKATLDRMTGEAPGTSAARIAQWAYDRLAGRNECAEHRLAVFAAMPKGKETPDIPAYSVSGFAFMKDAALFPDIPAVRMLDHAIRMFDPADPQQQASARRSARIVDDFIRASRLAQRRVEDFNQTGLGDYVAATGVDALLASKRAVWDALRLGALAMLADWADRDWVSLPADLGAFLGQGGIDKAMWDQARRFDLLGDDADGRFMDPVSMIRAGNKDQAEAGRRIDDLIERMVRSVMPASVSGDDPDRFGEKMLRRLKRAGIFDAASLLVAHARIWRSPSGPKRLPELADTILSLLVLGALSVQLKRIGEGVAAYDFGDIDLWRSAFSAGRVFGVYGDVLQSAAFAIKSAQAHDPANPRASDGVPLFGPAPGLSAYDENCFGWRAVQLTTEHLASSLLNAAKQALDQAVFWKLRLAADPSLAASMLERAEAAEKQADQHYRKAEREQARTVKH